MGQQKSTIKQLTKRQKGALLLLSLDLDTATKLMKDLSQEEVEQVAFEISNIKDVPTDLVEDVFNEYIDQIGSAPFLVQGGPLEAKKLIERSLGSPKASEVIEKVKNIANGTGFDKLRKADNRQLATFLQKEHPQTIALILSYLSPEKAAQVIAELPSDNRNDITLRMATLGKVSPTLLAEMGKIVDAIAASEITQELCDLGGSKSVATVLNSCDPTIAKDILEHIGQKNPDLATEIKRLMFVFDDIINIDDRGIQRVLREVDKKDLAISLKVVDEPLKDKIFANMSERARDLLKEELQYMGPLRLKEVEAAQQRIIDIVKQLEEQGEIVISGRGGKEEVVV
ncbi:MAG TPA: flagellar motor switch protein FliG [Bacteroidota bacterium]|nr:flagellar motor switch protein FliG [Bacteroidota bacterium]